MRETARKTSARMPSTLPALAVLEKKLHGLLARHEHLRSAYIKLKLEKEQAAAFQVMMELRQQPGIVRADTVTLQWVLYVATDCDKVYAARRRKLSAKYTYCFSPCFATQEDCEVAIKAVGEERILTAMRALAWAKTEGDSPGSKP